MNAIKLNTHYNKSILPLVVEWISAISTLYLIASLILNFECQRIALFVWGAATVADIAVNRRYQNMKWKREKWVFGVMAVFYLCIWIWHIFEDCSSAQFFHSTDTRLPFLIFGILGLFTTLNPKIDITHIAATMLAMSVATLAYIIYDNYAFISTGIGSINEFRENISILRHNSLRTTHIGSNVYMNCTMAMCFIAAQLSSKKWGKALLYIGILVIYATITLSEGRAGLITANLLVIAFIGFVIYRYCRKAIIPIVIVCVGLAGVGISKHNRLQLDMIKSEPRILIWEQAWELIKERPVLGYGVCDGRERFVTESLNNEELVKNFWDNWMEKHPDYKAHRFHCHNVFVESALEFGIVGLLLTIALFALPIVLTKGRKRSYIALIMLIFFIQSIFEAFTYHFQPMLFCLMVFIFVLSETEKLERNQRC